MNKKIVILSALTLTLLMLAVPVLAGPAGKSAVVHIDMVQKNPADWSIVDGAWGKFTYNSANGKFVFNGHDLVQGDYELICYQDPWNGEGSVSLGVAAADENGNVHISGTVDGDLPYYDYSTVDGDDYDEIGSKIWLVLDADFDGNAMTAWNPTAYLFETELIQ